MEFSCEYLDQLPPAYRTAVEHLLQKVEEAEVLEDRKKLLENFFRIYTMIPEFGKLFKKFTMKYPQTLPLRQKYRAKLRRMPLKHFYFEDCDTIFQFLNMLARRPMVRRT